MATITQTVSDVARAVLPHYEQVPETSHDLDWADLVTLDLSTFDSPGGKQALAKQLQEAVHVSQICQFPRVQGTNKFR